MGRFGRSKAAYALGEGLTNIGKVIGQQELLARTEKDKENAALRAQGEKLGIYLTGVPDEQLQSTFNQPAAPTQELGGQSMPGIMPEPSSPLQAPQPSVTLPDTGEQQPITQSRQLTPDVSVDLPAPAKLTGTPGVTPNTPAPNLTAPTAEKMLGTPNLMQEVGLTAKKQVLNPLDPGYGAPLPLPSGRGYYQPQASEQTNYVRAINAIQAAADRRTEGDKNRKSREQIAADNVAAAKERQLSQQAFVKDNPDYHERKRYDPATGQTTSWFENVKTGQHAPGSETIETLPTYAGFMTSHGSPQQMDKAQAASDMLLNMKVMKEVEEQNPNAPQLAANSINALAAMKETPMGLGSFIAVLARTNGLQYDDATVQKYGTAMYNYLQPVISAVGGKAVTANEIAIAMQGIIPFRNEDPASQAVKYANRVNKLTTAIAMAGNAWNNGLGGASAQQISEYFGVPIASTVPHIPGVPIPPLGGGAKVQPSVDASGPKYRRPGT